MIRTIGALDYKESAMSKVIFVELYNVAAVVIESIAIERVPQNLSHQQNFYGLLKAANDNHLARPIRESAVFRSD
jgi:hypothetical protein